MKCPSLQILNTTAHGRFTYCHKSKLFQFVFNNLCFELYEWELRTFIEYLYDIDVLYWEQQLQSSPHDRKIPISVGKNHFIILMKRVEIRELKELLSQAPKHRLLSYKEIEYSLEYN
ncbi:hypothetical protein HCO57_12935 [Croceivirga sp. JEA036]|nr:hypothetical protein [Croceivirga sp. JEA036]